MGETTTSVEKRGALRIVTFRHDTSDDDIWDKDEVTEEFLHPDDLDKATGCIDEDECEHKPHTSVTTKGPDEKYSATYCAFCGHMLHVS